MDRDEILKNFDGKINNTSPQNAVDPNAGGDANPTTSDDARFESLKNISYKEMMNSKIQASAVKDQALKYVSTPVAASGFGNQGLAESSRVGIYNTFNKAIMDADQKHGDNLLAIDNERLATKEQKQTEDWQTLMTMADSATSVEQLDEIKSMIDQGEFTEQQRRYFDFYYKSYKDQLGKVNTANVTSVYNYNDNRAYAYDENGGSVVTTDKFNTENETLKGAVANGTIAKDTYIQIHNESNQDLFLYYSTDGNMYYVSKEEFNKQADDKKVNIVGKKTAVNKGPMK